MVPNGIHTYPETTGAAIASIENPRKKTGERAGTVVQ
jgi:hypothetical protein